MEPTVETINYDGFVDALVSGDVVAVVAMFLLAIMVAVHGVTQGKISPTGAKVVSLVRGVVGGLTGHLLTAAVTGLDWRIALLAGVGGLLLSQGFIDLIRQLIPDYTSTTPGEPDDTPSST